MDAKLDKIQPVVEIIKPEKIHTLLEPGELGAMLELIVSDPETGKITERRVMKSRSFVRQFLELLYVVMTIASDAFPVSIKDTGGATRSVRATSPATSKAVLDCTAAAGSVDFGIIIGSGTTPPTISDFKIETIIPHATMNYSAMTFGLPTADATTSQMTLTRNFSNVSGAPVTVNEVALYLRAYDGAVRYFMVIRDIIAGGFAVPAGQTLTVNYRIQAVA